jgi:hypothetical protein
MLRDDFENLEARLYGIDFLNFTSGASDTAESMASWFAGGWASN